MPELSGESRSPTRFLKGLLQPVSHEQSEALVKTWVAYNIMGSRGKPRMEELPDLSRRRPHGGGASRQATSYPSARFLLLSALLNKLGVHSPKESQTASKVVQNGVE